MPPPSARSMSPDFRGRIRERCVSYVTLRWLSKKSTCAHPRRQQKTTARLRYMRKKNRALVPSNECCRWAVCAVAHWRPRRWLRLVTGAAPICTLGVGGPGCRLTASVDLTAFERCDRRHKLLFEYPIIFWTPRNLGAPERPPFQIASWRGCCSTPEGVDLNVHGRLRPLR
jgi:hypothetical protein